MTDHTQSLFQFSRKNIMKWKMYIFKMNDNMMHEIKYLIGIPVPTGSPDLVESVRLNNSALAIRWKPPVLRQQNGAMLGYQVLY